MPTRTFANCGRKWRTLNPPDQLRWELQFQIQRQQSLKAQIEAELRRFAALVKQSTLATQTQAVEAAGRHAAGLVDLAAGGRPAGIAALRRCPRRCMTSLALPRTVAAARCV